MITSRRSYAMKLSWWDQKMLCWEELVVDGHLQYTLS